MVVARHTAQVAMIGSGSFACAMLHVIAGNVLANEGEFKPLIKFWVHDAKAVVDVGGGAVACPSCLGGLF